MLTFLPGWMHFLVCFFMCDMVRKCGWVGKKTNSAVAYLGKWGSCIVKQKFQWIRKFCEFCGLGSFYFFFFWGGVSPQVCINTPEKGWEKIIVRNYSRILQETLKLGGNVRERNGDDIGSASLRWEVKECRAVRRGQTETRKMGAGFWRISLK